MDKTRTFDKALPDFAVTRPDLAVRKSGQAVRKSGQAVIFAVTDDRRNATRRPDPERVSRYWRGHWAEWVAVAFLVLHGYRILARRYRAPFGEIDLIARRGRRLAFVEVKCRPTLADAEASLTPAQAERIGRAAEHWMGRHRRYRDHDMGMDLIAIGQDGWPRHLPNTFHAAWDAWKRR
jgi:putative endonuclease